VAHDVYLRAVVSITEMPASLPARATCDSRYVLYLNGVELGRGPVRGEPEFLGWDEHDLAPHLRAGPNVVVAHCRHYGAPGPWWVPAPVIGSLGRGSFCFETAPDAPVVLLSGTHWQAVETEWLPSTWSRRHGLPPEIVDGRRSPPGLHEATVDGSHWPAAVVLKSRLGTVIDRPPAAPYTAPLPRVIPQLRSTLIAPARVVVDDEPVRADPDVDPVTAFDGLDRVPDGERRLSVLDLGRICLGHVRLRARAPAGAIIDVAGGEDLRADGLPELEPRNWAARYIAPDADIDAIVTFFDPVGLRYLAVHHPAGTQVEVDLDERTFPRPEGAAFTCDDHRFERLWQVGARTLDLCSTDAFLDCPGREQRAWVGDSYVHALVSYVSNPDWRLARHHLALAARSRRPDGLLAMAIACDLSLGGITIPDYSLHWIRALVRYWEHSGDENLVRAHVPVANGIIERYEQQRGASGLLEDFPGWVFVDWAQVERDSVTGAHDALYAAALADYATLPGASDVADLIVRTADAFEALWDDARGVYVDAVGSRGRSRRVSQQTNAAALLAGIVPRARVPQVIERVTDPARLVVTETPAGPSGLRSQWSAPDPFDVGHDVVAAQPFFCRFLHEALFRHGRRDLILASLLRWHAQVQRGNTTFEEYWDAPPGRSSRCHAWSASPTYDLVAYVVGVRPAAPGYASVVVDPYLGPLRRAAARVPTPRGWVSVRVEGDDVNIGAPDGMAVTRPPPTPSTPAR
jgi:hypothetical protein